MKLFSLPEKGFHLTNYIGLFGEQGFRQVAAEQHHCLDFLHHSDSVSSSLAGFAFAKYRFPGRNVLFVFLLATIMLPPQVTYIPLFILMSKLHVGKHLPGAHPPAPPCRGSAWPSPSS